MTDVRERIMEAVGETAEQVIRESSTTESRLELIRHQLVALDAQLHSAVAMIDDLLQAPEPGPGGEMCRHLGAIKVETMGDQPAHFVCPNCPAEWDAGDRPP